jgi:hypothetical protein
VYNDLAVCLIHRHFDMAPDEKLVEFGAVSTPWMYRHPDENMMGGSIKPRSWLFTDGKMVPYEFGYNEHGKVVKYRDLVNKPEFYADFYALLQQEGLTNMLGLTLLTERKQKGFMKVEKTFGRSNVVFTMKEDDYALTEKDSVPAQWEYAPAVGNFIVPVKKFVCSFGCICSRGPL